MGVQSKKFPAYVTFTFDDGTSDHLSYAAPILEKYGYRGLFSIVTDWIGHSNKLTWDGVRELVRRGHVIGSHTVSHPNMLKLLAEGRLDEIVYQISKSREIIEHEILQPLKYFCFPFNAHNGQLFRIVKKYGLEIVPCVRVNLGGAPANSVADLGAYLEQLSHRNRHIVLMFHQVVSGPGYAPYDDATGSEFEKRIASVKMHEKSGLYKVVNYGTADWPLVDIHALTYRAKNFLIRMAKSVYPLYD